MITTLLATALMTTTIDSAPPITDKDSAAYAIGAFIVENINDIDSTMNFDQMMFDGVKDVFIKKLDTQIKETQAYLTAVQIAQHAYTNVDSTLNPDMIISGIIHQTNNNHDIKPEEINQYIMNYVGKASLKKADEFLAKADAEPGVKKTESGLRYRITDPGTGELIDPTTEIAMVQYTLFDYHDNVIYSSRDHNDTLRAYLPRGVIPSFAEGISLASKGGKATLWMTTTLGYGQNDSESVAPNQTLKFEIEVLDTTVSCYNDEHYHQYEGYYAVESAEPSYEYESYELDYLDAMEKAQQYKTLYKTAVKNSKQNKKLYKEEVKNSTQNKTLYKEAIKNFRRPKK